MIRLDKCKVKRSSTMVRRRTGKIKVPMLRYRNICKTKSKHSISTVPKHPTKIHGISSKILIMMIMIINNTLILTNIPL